MDLDKLFKLIDKAEGSSFDKIKIKMEDVTLHLERGGAAQAPAAKPVQTVTAPVEPVTDEEVHSETDTVFAPISGVFYAAKEPGAAPFVSPGSKVKKGDTLCIIEAMKTMNEIAAPRAGVIERILKEDSEPVSANEPMFKYRGDAK